MKILLTGVTGYIGKRLLPVLLDAGHDIICCVRDASRFDAEEFQTENLEVLEVNFLDQDSLTSIPRDLDAAYYLIHSMSSTVKDFEKLEETCARNFVSQVTQTGLKQVIYLSGIANDDQLSDHLRSRKGVEEILSTGSFHLTTLRAGIIVGSGSASFEIIRDLVEKLPVMIAPKWLKTRSQPISIRNVIQFLNGVLLLERSYDRVFDIGGPEILTYREMLLIFAKIRDLKRFILMVPVMTPKLSSYWLYFVTSTSYKLAMNLVDSMKVEVICRENSLAEWLGIHLHTYEEAVKLAFDKIEQQEVLSSWTDALSGRAIEAGVNKLMQVPTFGCLSDSRAVKIKDIDRTVDKIWAIGGTTGWYYANFLWSVRGFIDKLFGGVGLRRGRKNRKNIRAGETLDFWRVLYASRVERRLLLYAEMKLPGEAWLEFKIKDKVLHQTATFRPRGVLGRIYWYMLIPMHHIIFRGMIRHIAQ
ncbi:MAG: SDR family oxidoreductase [Saprospiraceae bacterium]|nr:SDR family oxidoreductase [Saprospiraceae bacterium]